MEAGVKFEEIEIDLTNKPEWYLKINQVFSYENVAYGSKVKFLRWISVAMS